MRWWQVSGDTSPTGLKHNYVWHIRQVMFAAIPPITALVIVHCLSSWKERVDAENKSKGTVGGHGSELKRMPGHPIVESAVATRNAAREEVAANNKKPSEDIATTSAALSSKYSTWKLLSSMVEKAIGSEKEAAAAGISAVKPSTEAKQQEPGGLELGNDATITITSTHSQRMKASETKKDDNADKDKDQQEERRKKSNKVVVLVDSSTNTNTNNTEETDETDDDSTTNITRRSTGTSTDTNTSSTTIGFTNLTGGVPHAHPPTAKKEEVEVGVGVGNMENVVVPPTTTASLKSAVSSWLPLSLSLWLRLTPVVAAVPSSTTSVAGSLDENNNSSSDSGGSDNNNKSHHERYNGTAPVTSPLKTVQQPINDTPLTTAQHQSTRSAAPSASALMAIDEEKSKAASADSKSGATIDLVTVIADKASFTATTAAAATAAAATKAPAATASSSAPQSWWFSSWWRWYR